MNKTSEELLFIIEYGVYPELIHGLRDADYQVTVEHLMRKAINHLKKRSPPLVVAEFFHDPAFRDRVSNLESMLAHIQRKQPDTKVVVIYDLRDKAFLDQLTERFSVNRTIPFPVSIDQLLEACKS